MPRLITSCLVQCALCAITLQGMAQERHITSVKSVAVGYNATQDTYLSPEEYTGPELRLVSHVLRERDSTRWARLILNEGSFAYGESRSGNGSTLSGQYHFQYGFLRRFTPLGSRLTIRGGGQGEFLGGFIYNTRNGNNPAQARAMINVGAVASAEYRIGRATLGYEVSLPLLGLAFSPNYGQSYYEIFDRGHYDRNCVPTTVVCSPAVRHALTIDTRWLGATWRMGYLGDYRGQHVNHLKQHVYTSALIVGVVKSFYAGRRKP